MLGCRPSAIAARRYQSGAATENRTRDYRVTGDCSFHYSITAKMVGNAKLEFAWSPPQTECLTSRLITDKMDADLA